MGEGCSGFPQRVAAPTIRGRASLGKVKDHVQLLYPLMPSEHNNTQFKRVTWASLLIRCVMAIRQALYREPDLYTEISYATKKVEAPVVTWL